MGNSTRSPAETTEVRSGAETASPQIGEKFDVQCGTCNGVGMRNVYRNTPLLKGYFEEPCETCKGNGFVEAEVFAPRFLEASTGRCCGRKPLTYKRPQLHYYCCRCDAEYDANGAQHANSAWYAIGGGFAPKYPTQEYVAEARAALVRTAPAEASGLMTEQTQNSGEPQ